MTAESPSDRHYRKCNRCRIVYYCSERCQRRGWLTHKQVCKPPEPKVRASVGFLLPHLMCSIAYQKFNDPRCDDPVPVCLISTEEWIARFGHEQLKKTVLSLAARGRPDFGSLAGFVTDANENKVARILASSPYLGNWPRPVGPQVGSEPQIVPESSTSVPDDFVDHVPTVMLEESLERWSADMEGLSSPAAASERGSGAL